MIPYNYIGNMPSEYLFKAHEWAGIDEPYTQQLVNIIDESRIYLRDNNSKECFVLINISGAEDNGMPSLEKIFDTKEQYDAYMEPLPMINRMTMAGYLVYPLTIPLETT